jgi:uncharacterized protein
MFRDFHVIRDDEADILFFPATYRLYRISKADAERAEALLAGQADAAPSGVLEELIAKEASAAGSETRDSKPWGETDSLCLYVANDCNLECAYCYNRSMRSSGPGMMSPDVAEAAFRRFFTQAGKRYAVAFYGGEPLLNFRAIRQMVEAGRGLEQARNIRIDFSITTNGTVFSREIGDFIAKHFSAITVSLDGPQEIHDAFRTGPKGGSHEKVLKNLKRLQARCGSKVAVSGTLTAAGASAYSRTRHHLREEGNNRFVLTPVYVAKDNPAAISDSAYESYCRQHESLCIAALDNQLADGSEAPKEALTVATNLLTHRKLRRHCNAGRDLAVGSDGSLYACHGLVGIPEFHMGRVGDEDDADKCRVRKLFAGLDVDSIPQCSVCWARYFCGGSCYAHSYFGSGTVSSPHGRHCELTLRCTEAAIKGFLRIVGDGDSRKRLYARVRKYIGAEES